MKARSEMLKFAVKREQNQARLSYAGIADEISNIKFIEDFDKIMNFMLAMSHA